MKDGERELCRSGPFGACYQKNCPSSPRTPTRPLETLVPARLCRSPASRHGVVWPIPHGRKGATTVPLRRVRRATRRRPCRAARGRVTVWPSKTPVPQTRADFSLSAKSRWTSLGHLQHRAADRTGERRLHVGRLARPLAVDADDVQQAVDGRAQLLQAVAGSRRRGRWIGKRGREHLADDLQPVGRAGRVAACWRRAASGRIRIVGSSARPAAGRSAPS